MGVLWSMLRYSGPIFRQSYPPEPEFSTKHIPDLTGRVVIVTGMYIISFSTILAPGSEYIVITSVPGGNAGIGKETVRVLSCRERRRLDD